VVGHQLESDPPVGLGDLSSGQRGCQELVIADRACLFDVETGEDVLQTLFFEAC